MRGASFLRRRAVTERQVFVSEVPDRSASRYDGARSHKQCDDSEPSVAADRYQ